jgi:hypothetical protein
MEQNKMKAHIAISITILLLFTLASSSVFGQSQLLVAGLPSDMIGQPVICEEGKFIDEQMGRYHYEFATQCTVGEINDMQIWLRDFDSQFRDGLMSWGNITEYGWHEFNREFTPGGVNQ